MGWNLPYTNPFSSFNTQYKNTSSVEEMYKNTRLLERTLHGHEVVQTHSKRDNIKKKKTMTYTIVPS